jgi:hypothetical protein
LLPQSTCTCLLLHSVCLRWRLRLLRLLRLLLDEHRRLLLCRCICCCCLRL